MSVKKQIALFGGSFDPIHNGHVKLLEQVCKTFSFDEVILLPCRQSPHKATRPQATDQQRLTMCQLATSHLPKVTVNSNTSNRNTQTLNSIGLWVLINGTY